jgi:rare lipoprotein A
MMKRFILLSIFLLSLSGCVQSNSLSGAFGSSKGYEAQGTASWYGRAFRHSRTSSGEPYNMYAFTAAHKTLPFSTYVLVTNLFNGRQVVVRVNDRGPYVHGRLIDLSYAAAKRLGMIGMGTAEVNVKALS